MSVIRYKIQRDAEKPIAEGRKGRKKWNIPLEEMEPGDGITLYMSTKDALKKVNAIRSYVCREQRYTEARYSVYLHKDGVFIWRRPDVDLDEDLE